MIYERQCDCREFEEILHQREYGQSDDWESPVDDHTVNGVLLTYVVGAQCFSVNPLPLMLRVLDFIPPSPDFDCQRGKLNSVLKDEQVTSSWGFHFRIVESCCNTACSLLGIAFDQNVRVQIPSKVSANTVKEWATGSGADSNVLRDGDTSGYTDVEHTSIPAIGEVCPPPGQRCPRLPDVEQGELELHYDKRLCTRCGLNEVYNGSEHMDWCEPCIWEFVKDE